MELRFKNITHMNYEDDEEEEVKDPDHDLHKFRLRHNDMRIDLVKLIVRSRH